MKGKKIHVMTVIMKQDGKSKFKMYNFGCLKLTALKKINRVKIIIGMYYDSYLIKIKLDLDFHLIDFVFCLML